MTRRCIGLDVHREFAQVAIWEAGVVRQVGRIATTPEALRLFVDSLAASDEVALEATGNTHAIARLLEGRVARVVVANPAKTRAIAEAKVKTDKVDAEVLAQLLAADLPAFGVAARRRDPRAASAGSSARADRAPADAAEEWRPRDPASQSGAALSGRRSVREEGSRVAGRAGPSGR